MGRGKWLLPAEVNPPESYTVCICVPNERGYIAAFWGALQELAYQFNWERDPEHKALDVSIKWNAILADANQRSNGEPLMCFTCTELTECITPLLTAQTQLFKDMLNTSKYGDAVQPGEPLPQAERERDLAEGTNPTCDLDILCGECKGVVNHFIALVTDVLEQAEATTNPTEFLDVVTQITGLDEASADVITGYLTFIQEAINEAYTAQVTQAYKDAATCSLWCRCRDDCQITADNVYNVFKDRLEEAIGTPIGVFTTLEDLFQFLIGVPMTGTIIADVMHLIVAGGGVLAGLFMGDVGTKSLELIIDLAKDEPSNDCALLCEPCPPEDVTPVLNPTPCDASNPGGTNIEHLGGAQWRVTSTLAGGDARVMITEAAGLPFRINNLAFPDGDNVLALWLPDGGVCTIGNDVPVLTPLTQCGWTWLPQDAGKRVIFEMYPA